MADQAARKASGRTPPKTPALADPPSQPLVIRTRANTVIDVARLAGVSPAAVSRAFTPGSSISPEKRQAVLEAARHLRYRPNLLARSLITGRSNIIGIVLTHFDNQFYPALVQELSIALGAKGFRTLLFMADISKDAEQVIEELLRYHVDAVILGSIMLSDRSAEACRSAGVPTLLLNHKTDSLYISSVTSDNFRAARVVAAFLLAGGHKSFGIVAGLGNTSASRDRESGFLSYLREQQVPEAARSVGYYSYEVTRAAARELLSVKSRPEAVFCGNDQMAFTFIGVARHEFGLAIGKDISVVGFDDAPMSVWPDFDLTTYSQPIPMIVARTVEALESMLENPDQAPVRAVITGELIVRGSARTPRTGLMEVDGRLIWRPHAKYDKT